MAPEHERDEGHVVTRLLNGVAEGQADARQDLIDLVYSELRKIAQNRMAVQEAGHTLQATELVHEAYLRLAGEIGEHNWESRAHFFGAAADSMRRILIDHARKKGRAKRGGGRLRIGSNVLELVAAEDNAASILALEEAFQRLERMDKRLAQIVRFRFFAGLSVEETALALGISKRGVVRHWIFARTWLYRELGGTTTAPVEHHEE
jgi:RNA polymerase sigma factor (TIGR02999 family)